MQNQASKPLPGSGRPPLSVGLQQPESAACSLSHDTPRRVQRKRTKGYRMPENTISVCRPGKWGNPFEIAQIAGAVQTHYYVGGKDAPFLTKEEAQKWVVDRFRSMMLDLNSIPVEEESRLMFRYMRDRIRDLQGKNLACFCPESSPCHGDVLLELANPVARTRP